MKILLLFTLLAFTTAYKILMLAPDISNSQLIFNSRVAKVLAEANHEVHLVLTMPFEGRGENPTVKMDERIHVKRVNVSIGMHIDKVEEIQAPMVFQDLPLYDKKAIEAMDVFLGSFIKSCRKTLENKEFMSWLVDQKFDIAFSHNYHFCPIGLIHHAKIPTWIWTSSAVLMDFQAAALGVPSTPSFIPPLIMAANDKMDFWQRTKSFLSSPILHFFYKRMVVDAETEIFRDAFGPDFPDLWDIAKSCPLVLVNSNEQYDLPRPTLAKIINIGGVGIQQTETKPLTGELGKRVDAAEGIVLFSFGSVAPAHEMPQKWKEAIMEAFSRFPKILFIMRYKMDDIKELAGPNVYLSGWLPQNDILRHPKLKMFVTHGGYNSFQETVSAGVPTVTIPLFGDQPRVAKIAEKHGISIIINKRDMNADNLYNAIKTVVENQSYRENAGRLAALVKEQPFSANERLVKWVEFVAKFKTLDNLVPASQELSFIQYFSLDVIAFVSAVIFAVLFITYKISRCILRRIARALGLCSSCQKAKTD